MQARHRGTLQALRAACRPQLLLRFLQLGVPGAIMMSAVGLHLQLLRGCQLTMPAVVQLEAKWAHRAAASAPAVQAFCRQPHLQPQCCQQQACWPDATVRDATAIGETLDASSERPICHLLPTTLVQPGCASAASATDSWPELGHSASAWSALRHLPLPALSAGTVRRRRPRLTSPQPLPAGWVSSRISGWLLFYCASVKSASGCAAPLQPVLHLPGRLPCLTSQRLARLPLVPASAAELAYLAVSPCAQARWRWTRTPSCSR